MLIFICCFFLRRVMNSAKSHPFSGWWTRCIQIYRLSLAISFQHCVRLCGMQSTTKSICPNVISTATIRISTPIHTVNPVVCGHLITFSTTRNWNASFSSHAEPSSEYEHNNKYTKVRIESVALMRKYRKTSLSNQTDQATFGIRVAIDLFSHFSQLSPVVVRVSSTISDSIHIFIGLFSRRRWIMKFLFIFHFLLICCCCFRFLRCTAIINTKKIVNSCTHTISH